VVVVYELTLLRKLFFEIESPPSRISSQGIFDDTLVLLSEDGTGRVHHVLYAFTELQSVIKDFELKLRKFSGSFFQRVWELQLIESAIRN